MPDLAEIARQQSANAFREIVQWNLGRMTRLSRGVAYQIALFAKGAEPSLVASVLAPPVTLSEVGEAIDELVFSLGLQRLPHGVVQFHQVVGELLMDSMVERCVEEFTSRRFEVLTQVLLCSCTSSQADRRASERQILGPLLERMDVEAEEATGDLLLVSLDLARSGYSAEGVRLNLASNIVILLMHRRPRLLNVDLSSLVFRHVDFSVSELHSCDLSDSQFDECTFTLPHAAVLDIAWSGDDDDSIIGADALGNLLAWSGEEYRELQFERISRSWLRAVIAFGAKRIIAGGDDNELILARRQDLHPIDRKRVPDMYWIRALAVEGTSGTICSGSEDGSVRFWDVSGDRLHMRATWPLLRGTVRSVRFLGDGRAVAACDQGSVAVIHPGQSAVSYFDLGERQVRCLDVERGRGLVAAYADDAGLWVVDLASRASARKPPTSSGSIRTLAWTADGESVVASGDDGVVWRWPVTVHEGRVHILDPAVVASLPGRVVALKVAPHGTNAVLSTEGEATYFAELNDERVLPLSNGSARRMWTVSGSPDGTHVVSGGEDRQARVWRRSTDGSLEEIGALRPGGRVWRARYAVSGRFICTASDDNIVRLWDVGDLSIARVWTGHRDWVLDIATLSIDGEDLFLSASNDQRVGLWSPRHESATWFHHHDSRVLRVGVMNSKHAVSSSSDETLAVFDPVTGKVTHRGTLPGHKAWGLDICTETFSVATGGDDGRVCIWSLSGDSLTPRVIGTVPGSILEVRFFESGNW